MKVICITQDGMRRFSLDIKPFLHLFLPIVLLMMLVIGLGVNQWLSSWSVEHNALQTRLSPSEVDNVLANLQQQLTAIEELKRSYDHYTVDVDTLAVRLGGLEADLIRLNAIAARVIHKAQLDPKEFALEAAPARGGLDDDYFPATTPSVSAGELLTAFEQFELSLTEQWVLLSSLAQIIERKVLNHEVQPSLLPVEQGYISSGFGFRRDPFNGRLRKHGGIDFAGPTGTPIYAVAGGVVSFVGRMGSYGKVVEIDHGNDLISRYAHLDGFVVNEGQIVEKGRQIARMGSTGRSTGPHLHLEILLAGQRVDPKIYLTELD